MPAGLVPSHAQTGWKKSHPLPGYMLSLSPGVSQNICTCVGGLSLLVGVVSQDIVPSFLPSSLDHFCLALGKAEGR